MKRFLFILVAMLLTLCTQAPKAEQGVPRLVDTNVTADAVSAELTATFDHAGNIKEAGFELLTGEGGRSLRSGATPEGNTINTTFEGLLPETEYRYLVFWSNGREEQRSEERSFRTSAAPEEPDDRQGPDQPDQPDQPNQPDQPDQPEAPVDPTSLNPNLLKHLLKNCDTDGNGEISQAELLAIEELNLSSILLEDTRGLELIANLRSVSFGYNWLTTLDLSANKKLEFLSAGGDTHLQEIILDNPELVQTYFVGDSGVKHLDFTRCPKIYICEWWDFPVETVDFTGCEDLHAVRIGNSRLREIDLSAAWKLRHLNIKDNPLLQTIRLKKGVELESLEYDTHAQIIYK